MLDTNACIAVMNERPARVKAQLLKKSIETVGMSVISLLNGACSNGLQRLKLVRRGEFQARDDT